MKITAIEPFVCEAGWGRRTISERGGIGRHSWVFVKVSTDEGIVGWAEAYDWQAGPSLAEAIRVVGDEFIGEDPTRIEWVNQIAWAAGRGGVPERQKVIAALDIACWDIKGKWLGVPVYQLLGGAYRDRIPLYWSHFGGYRRWFGDRIGLPPAPDIASWVALADDVLNAGFRVLKTNILLPDAPGAPSPSQDGWITRGEINATVAYIAELRNKVGPDIGIALDLGHAYRMGAIVQLAKALEPYDLYWLEIESFDADALLAVKRQTRTRLCTGESLIRREQFLPFLQRHVTDVVMIETLANGISESRRIAELAGLFDTLVSPHNYMSPFGTLVNAQLCAATPNVEILEIDVDDAAWKLDLVTERPEIVDGHLVVSTRPGIGAEINEEVVRAHPFQRAEQRNA